MLFLYNNFDLIELDVRILILFKRKMSWVHLIKQRQSQKEYLKKIIHGIEKGIQEFFERGRYK